MKKHQLILILFFILLYLVFFYFNHSTPKEREVYLSDLNGIAVDIDRKITIYSKDISFSSYLLWGLNKSKLLEDREKKSLKESEKKIETLNSNKPKERNVKVKYRTICVEKHCWQLVGIMSINGIKTLTMLNKEKKSKLELFKIGDELLPNIIIEKIKGESMILLNQENHKKIILKLFDVDLSQYLPKKSKEKNE